MVMFALVALQDPTLTQDRPPAVEKRSEPRCKGCATSRKRAPRSTAAHNAFRTSHPCPATGDAKGACRGYVVDHVIPLACGRPRRPVQHAMANQRGRQSQGLGRTLWMQQQLFQERIEAQAPLSSTSSFLVFRARPPVVASREYAPSGLLSEYWALAIKTGGNALDLRCCLRLRLHGTFVLGRSTREMAEVVSIFSKHNGFPPSHHVY